MSDIIVGSAAVDIVPDTRRFAETLKAKLKGITAHIAVDADTARLRAQLDEATRERTATVNVDADTAAAAAKIDEVARDRTANIRVNESGLGNATSGISGMAAAVAGLGPALIPATAAIGGFGAALAAPLAAAGGGLTVYGILTGLAVKQTQKQIKAIGDLKKKVDAAKLAVDKASTPAGKKSAMASLAAATLAYKTALDGLTPAQKRFKETEDHLKGSFNKLIATAGPAMLGPLVKGMNLLSKVLPKIRPVLVGVSKGIGTLFHDVAGFTKGPGFKTFMQAFGSASRSAIVSFGRIFENFGKGLFGIFRAFAPLSGAFIGGLTALSQKFANFGANAGSNKGFQGFLAYVKDVGPKVAQTIGDIVGAAVNIVKALAPLGGVVLGVIDGIAKFIKKASPGTLEAIGVAVGGIALAFGKSPLGLAFALAATLSHSGAFMSFLKKAGSLASTLADAFNSLPAGIKTAAIGAVGIGVISRKLSGGGLFGGKGGIAGIVGNLFSRKSPMPVIVMNPGFKLPGGGSTVRTAETTVAGAEAVAAEKVATRTGAKGVTGVLLKALDLSGKIAEVAARVNPILDTAITLWNATGDQAPGQNDAGLTKPQIKAHHSMQAAVAGLYKNLGADQFGFKNGVSADQLLANLLGKDPGKGFRILKQAADTAGVAVNKFATDAMPKTQAAIKNLHGEINVLPKDVHVQFNEPGLSDAQRAVLQYGSYLDNLPRQVVTNFVHNIMTHNDIGAGGGGTTQPPNRSPHVAPRKVVPRQGNLFVPHDSGSGHPRSAAAGGGMQRFSLDVGGGKTLTGIIQDEFHSQHAYHATTGARRP